MLPPPCFTVCLTWNGWRGVSFFLKQYWIPSEFQRLIFVSSEKITRFQSSTVQCWWAFAHWKRAFLCLLDKKGFLDFLRGLIPIFRRLFRVDWYVICTPWRCRSLYTSFPVLHDPERTLLLMSWSVLTERTRGLPEARSGNVGRQDLLSLNTVIKLTPASCATWEIDPRARRRFNILGVSWIGNLGYTDSNPKDEACTFILFADKSYPH